jgi:hypothetical protein
MADGLARRLALSFFSMAVIASFHLISGSLAYLAGGAGAFSIASFTLAAMST